MVERVAPLGVTLQRFGNARTGPNRFDVAQVKIGSQTRPAPETVTESFTRAHFVDMSEEEKLSTPSFERFTAGISVGSSTYSLPAGQIKGKLEYETTT